jgi:hypothetical protein
LCVFYALSYVMPRRMKRLKGIIINYLYSSSLTVLQKAKHSAYFRRIILFITQSFTNIWPCTVEHVPTQWGLFDTHSRDRNLSDMKINYDGRTVIFPPTCVYPKVMWQYMTLLLYTAKSQYVLAVLFLSPNCGSCMWPILTNNAIRVSRFIPSSVSLVHHRSTRQMNLKYQWGTKSSLHMSARCTSRNVT